MSHTEKIHANRVTEQEVVDKLCLLSLCEVQSDCETLVFADAGALVNAAALNHYTS